MKSLATFVGLAAALVSMGAGLYLLTKGSPQIDVGGAVGQSWLEVLAHGIGAYFLARGLWMASQLLADVEND